MNRTSRLRTALTSAPACSNTPYLQDVGALVEVQAHRQDISHAVAKSLDHIHTHFHEPVTLPDLATIAGLSISRFAFRFTQEVGLSPHQYLKCVRVHHAIQLLMLGISPSIVAAEVGFFDQSHLCRNFKRVLGTTPGQWVSRTMSMGG